MGGRSRSRVTFDGSTAVFEGEVSLENNGGFASVRTRLEPLDLSDRDGIELQIRGRGETLQLRLRTDNGWDGVAYRAYFRARRKAPWCGSRSPLSVPPGEAASWTTRPPLDPAAVTQIGFLIADGQEGAFQLRVDRIDTYRDGGGEDEQPRLTR